MSHFPLGDKIVKPARPRGWYLDLMVVAPQGVALERTGEVHPREELSAIVAAEPKSLVIVQAADRMLWELHQVFRGDPDWNYQLKPVHPRGNGRKGHRITATVVRHFGWKHNRGDHGKGRAGNHYHLCIDPTPLCAARIDELVDLPGATELEKLYLWGSLLRNWLLTQRLPPAPSAGALGATLTRSPLWFTDSRKVPRATNARLRPFLPGNHHRLYTDQVKSHNGVKLDMSAAHHQVAASIPLPSANTFVIRGHKPHVTDGTEGTPPPWCTATSRMFRSLLDSHHGFLFARVTVPTRPRGTILHPTLETPGPQDAGLWTTAIPHLLDRGLVIEAIYWTASTPQVDPAVNSYARFALRTISETDPLLRPTVKRILLSAYGIKAAIPNRMERGVRLSDKGETGAYPAGSGVLPVKRLRMDHEIEPLLAHVAHRAMIEEGLRVRVIEQAQFLQAAGHRVLCIYADAIIVESTGHTLPLLPDPWKSAEPLTGLRFLADNGTAYTATEESRLPGIPRERREFVDRLRAIR